MHRGCKASWDSDKTPAHRPVPQSGNALAGRRRRLTSPTHQMLGRRMSARELGSVNLASVKGHKDGLAFNRSLNITKALSMGQIVLRRVQLVAPKASKLSNTKIKAKHRKDILAIHRVGAMETSTLISRDSKVIGSERYHACFAFYHLSSRSALVLHVH
jgi:hypothetical protein